MLRLNIPSAFYTLTSPVETPSWLDFLPMSLDRTRPPRRVLPALCSDTSPELPSSPEPPSENPVVLSGEPHGPPEFRGKTRLSTRVLPPGVCFLRVTLPETKSFTKSLHLVPQVTAGLLRRPSFADNRA